MAVTPVANGADGCARLTLAEVMAATGLPASTVHHYRRAGLLPPLDPPTGRRAYGDEHVVALRAIRWLRTSHGLPLDRIAEVLPPVLAAASATGGDPRDRLAAAEAALDACEAATARRRAIESATRLFSTRSYGEVSVAEVAADAGMAKGSVYRHFASKEELFVAVVDDVVASAAAELAACASRTGAATTGGGTTGAEARAGAEAFAAVVARAMPVLLELGARAAKGHDPSRALARRVLCTLATAAGRPAAGPDGDPTAAGLALIEQAFAMVLRWSVDGRWIDESGETGSGRGSTGRRRA